MAQYRSSLALREGLIEAVEIVESDRFTRGHPSLCARASLKPR